MIELGFAESLDGFADRVLGITRPQLDWFLSGKSRRLPLRAIKRLKWKLDIAHNTCAAEIEATTHKFAFWPARSRYNMVQNAFDHFDELVEQLA